MGENRMRTWFYQTIHPLLLSLMKVRGKKSHILNQCPSIQGSTIYIVNHSTKYDFPITAEGIGHMRFSDRKATFGFDRQNWGVSQWCNMGR
jgi:hypothetical protein